MNNLLSVSFRIYTGSNNKKHNLNIISKSYQSAQIQNSSFNCLSSTLYEGLNASDFI